MKNSINKNITNKIDSTITLLSPDGNGEITILSHMKDYYLKIGYLPLKKKFIKKNFFRKIKILIKLISRSDITFKDPKKRDIIIYDCEATSEIKKVLPNENYEVLSTRAENIKVLYFSGRIFLFMILNFFKNTLKQNYIAALIKIIAPKVVITHIDNSRDFHITARIFWKKIKFIAIQNANRGDLVVRSTEITKKIFIPEFLCFSSFDEQIYKKNKSNIGKFEIVGSLRASLSNEYVKSKKININPNRYDICLLSEPHTAGTDIDKTWSHVKNFAETVGKIAEYTHRLCKEKNLNLIFSGKQRLDKDMCEMENYFYKKYLKDYNFKIYHGLRNEYPTYQNIMQSKLIIGHNSTMLREAFSFEKKVLSCNFTGHPDIIFPSEGLCYLNDVSYNDFKERVLQILSMTKEEYFEGLSEQRDFIMKSTIDTANIIRHKLKNLY